GVVAAVVHPMFAELQQELSGIRELQDLCVLLAIAGDPDVAVVVHGDAMVAVRPPVSGAWPTPGLHEVATLVIDEYGRCDLAAHADGILGGRTAFRAPLHLVVYSLGDGEIRGLEIRFDSAGTMDRPHAVLCVDREADRRARDPVIRQRPGPERIDFEHRGLRGRLA